ncbi:MULTISPECIES: PTS fructose transporter subunit IIB [Bacillaceae]|uniref:PTS fructose transporter subunit IIB n=1 Tax=Bacillaceae TaxID=186817 RepID=UPI000D54E309|nr:MULTISPECIES: PTS fructose transporter subunit IIB [Bacillaceae]AWI13768.1 PTS fructose transporter subunit IIBC [Caldibacillus thermoamylovorans]MCM3478577.1 fructose PTS transporter subunit IIB [Caldibacillus thermoamylovorans]MEC5273121.1 fructose PTS transporter subunit IIB [Caldifermentibacillus hisashii]
MKLVAVTACTTGIAHTYMAQEALEKECKKRGYEIKVETQGGLGIENELTEEEIAEADAVILAVSIGIEGDERFDEKRDEGKVLTMDPSVLLKDVSSVIDQAEKI